eukprot:3191177-Rhodomonas_salina.1
MSCDDTLPQACVLDSTGLGGGESRVVEVLEPVVLGNGTEDAHQQAVASDLVAGELVGQELDGAVVMVALANCILDQVLLLYQVAVRELDDDDSGEGLASGGGVDNDDAVRVEGCSRGQFGHRESMLRATWVVTTCMSWPGLQLPRSAAARLAMRERAIWSCMRLPMSFIWGQSIMLCPSVLIAWRQRAHRVSAVLPGWFRATMAAVGKQKLRAWRMSRVASSGM